jgi:hypothetical protein
MRGPPPHPWMVGLVWLAAATGIAHAGDVYKSVDAGGNVVYSDHVDPSSSQTKVVLPEDPHYPPRQMHVCGTKNCFTLMLDNGSYRRADGTDDTWTIESFTPQSVVLRRHGTPTANTDVTYSGDVVNDRLADVRVNGTLTGGIDASWGSALDALPGTNAERDARNSAIMSAPSSGALSTATTPPPLPTEDQSEIPEPGYLWTPGYWYWREQGYGWVPGAWVHPPQIGFLWTPAFWGLANTVFVFHPGYWGPTVGFYGAINYGHGYFGTGYTGGRWVGGSFAYNSSVNRLSAAVKNTYSAPPPNPGSGSLMSYSAGPGIPATSTVQRVQSGAPIVSKRQTTTNAAQNANASARKSETVNQPVVVATHAPSRPPPDAPSATAPPKLNQARPIKASAPKK